jgi:hypothetical protein
VTPYIDSALPILQYDRRLIQLLRLVKSSVDVELPMMVAMYTLSPPPNRANGKWVLVAKLCEPRDMDEPRCEYPKTESDDPNLPQPVSEKLDPRRANERIESADRKEMKLKTERRSPNPVKYRMDI